MCIRDRYYGGLEGRTLAPRRVQVEPIQQGVRRISVKAPAELPVLVMGYKAPTIRDVNKDCLLYTSRCV